MWDIIRDSTIGQLLRLVSTQGKLSYPEENADSRPHTAGHSPALPLDEEDAIDICPCGDPYCVGDQSCEDKKDLEAEPCASVQQEPPRSPIRQPSPPSPCLPTVADAINLVTWYNDRDEANPQNWSSVKKFFVAGLIYLYTFVAYTGVSIYVASVEGVMEKFHVNETVASLGLSLYILGCGIGLSTSIFSHIQKETDCADSCSWFPGPLLFSPLSEIPLLGRSYIYTSTFTLFTLLCIPTALVSNLPGFLILRFLLGFFASPPLATGGASLADMFSAENMPYAIALWAAAATCGPGLGPVVAGFAVQAKGWRWSAWELLWLAAPVLILLLLFLPETSADAILLRRARSLRRVTGRREYMAQPELNQTSLTARQIAVEALIKPVEINILDPAVLFTTFYTALVYGISYSFFESFPLVYTDLYGLGLGRTGLTFLVMVIAMAIGPPIYCLWAYVVAVPAIRDTRGQHSPEALLLPGVIASGPLAIGLFIFAWTARQDVSLFVSLSGVVLNQISFYFVMQSVLLYIGLSYPKYAASLFAANDFARSTFAAGAVLFARPMFVNLGVDWGVTLLACLAVVCVGEMVLLYAFGADWRKRSRFAVKPDVR
ncbi:hypothetical protein PRZ48_012852 [Zasmidium cellare]|uniref:Major facilitator superfamily (MFS) profile domain-containing protein n=1 Tax=Zasmidium cellare TaxID=395010 RepID=A0ABR0E2M5_ZASCE|nr:hypothetical protein PRZ48_012852 [Zasmidium cellare]